MLRRCTLLLLVASAVLPGGAGAASTRDALWATVNQCDPAAHPGAVGIRVAIPDRAGAPEQWARIGLQWFDGAARAWRALRSPEGRWVRLGAGGRPVEGGTTFSFSAPPAGSRLVVRGVVDVRWRKGGKVVDRARVRTSAGHADGRDRNLGASHTSCEIAR